MDKNLSNEELLKQLYALKHAMERRVDRNVAVSKYSLMENLIKKHPIKAFFLKKAIRKEMDILNERGISLDETIARLENESRDIIIALPSGLVSRREYVNAAIDDIVMGRATGVTGVAEMYKRRLQYYRKSVAAG